MAPPTDKKNESGTGLAVDLKRQVPRVDVPVFVAAGRYDFLAPTSVSRDWFDALDAPRKDWRWFENSAHFPMFEEPKMFDQYLEEVPSRWETP